MKFKVDENLPTEACAILQRAGHDAVTVHDQGLTGSPDTHLAEICRAEDRALITLDHDFIDIRAYPPGDYSGIVALKLGSQAKSHVLRTIEQRVLPHLQREPLARTLWVVDEVSIRIRTGD